MCGLHGNRTLPGDVAIYREDGDIVHSGIVVEIKATVPWVLGNGASAMKSYTLC